MNIVPFDKSHIDAIIPQRAQASDLLMAREDESSMDVITENSDALTGMVDGKPVFCIGKTKQWKGRYIVWALLSNTANKHMVAIVRACRRIIEAQRGDGRHEIIVRADFQEGCKLAKMMGFKFHHDEERFLPDGTDAKIYVRYI